MNLEAVGYHNKSIPTVKTYIYIFIIYLETLND